MKRVIACAPPFNGQPNVAIAAVGGDGGAASVSTASRRSSGWGDGRYQRTIAPVDMIVGPGNAFVAEANANCSVGWYRFVCWSNRNIGYC
ncbi:histidinol dehydrogenase [Vibrio lentus]|nr:histidinol dehydrogenase [Vibrio lentus]